MNNIVSAKCCHKQVCRPSPSEFGCPRHDKQTGAITLSSVFYFRTDKMIELNRVAFHPFLTLKEPFKQRKKKESNFPELLI